MAGYLGATQTLSKPSFTIAHYEPLNIFPRSKPPYPNLSIQTFKKTLRTQSKKSLNGLYVYIGDICYKVCLFYTPTKWAAQGAGYPNHTILITISPYINTLRSLYKKSQIIKHFPLFVKPFYLFLEVLDIKLEGLGIQIYRVWVLTIGRFGDIMVWERLRPLR